MRYLLLLPLFLAVFAVSTVAEAQAPRKPPRRLLTSDDQQQMDSMSSQSMGQYPAMSLDYMRSLGLHQRAWNDPLQHMGEGQTRPGYSRYTWNPDLVLPIRLREGMLTLVNFPEWELIEEVYIGDMNLFSGDIAAPNALLLNPREPGADTNIIVFGRSGNRYVFYVRSETYNTERLTHSVVDIEVDNATASGNVGPVGAKGGSGGGKKGGSLSAATSLFTASHKSDDDFMDSVPVDPEKFRFDIDIFIPNPEDAEIAPERVWRDEIFTYIDFGKKALNMTQRPVVNLLLQKSEVPVGFRTKGKYSRLMIVEGIGDMILRNGQRIVCLKMRRRTDEGYENTSYFGTSQEQFGPVQSWRAPRDRTGSDLLTYPWQGGTTKQDGERTILDEADGTSSFRGNFAPTMAAMGVAMNRKKGAGSQAERAFDDLPSSYAPEVFTTPNGYAPGSGDISIELGSGGDIGKLEKAWSDMSGKHTDLLSGFDPYYSVESEASGSGVETFRLRIGPVPTLKAGDILCNRLGRRGIPCNVVRTQ